MWWWLRNFVRRNTRPIKEDVATRWTRRLNFIYLLAAWNAGGFVFYMCLTGRADWAKYYGVKEDNRAPYSQQWAELLNIPKAHVIQVKGLKKVGEYDIDLENSSPVVDVSTGGNLPLPPSSTSNEK